MRNQIQLNKTLVNYNLGNLTITLELTQGQRFLMVSDSVVWKISDIEVLGDNPEDILVTFKDISSSNPDTTYNMNYIRQRLNFGDATFAIL